MHFTSIQNYIRSIFLILIMFGVVFTVQAAPPRYVILCIGDGMGPEHVKAGGMFTHGAAGTLSFESLPYQAMVTTYSANNSVTDSAAAATAMATGVKVNNDVVSVRLPGNGSALTTVLEVFKSLNRSTGLVTTTYMPHATPSAFGAHETSRYNYSNIANDYLTQSKPNVLFGGGQYMSVSSAQAVGYTVVTDRAQMLALNTETSNYVSGQFRNDMMPYEYDGMGVYPHLSEMTQTALNILDNDPDGFFLMMEGGLIDQAAHSYDIVRECPELREFDNAVQVVLNWAQGRTDALVIVVADHETCGLQVVTNNGQGNPPTVNWTATYHTAANVPAYAWGNNSYKVTGTLNNTDIFRIMTADATTSVSPSIWLCY